MSVIILDTETTGVAKTDKVIELSYFQFQKDYKISNFIALVEAHGVADFISTIVDPKIHTSRYFPNTEMNPRAFEVHGIALHELTTEPPSSTVNIPEVTYILGHNISFDKRMLEQSNPELVGKLENVKFICTLALSKALNTFLNLGFEKHSLDYLTEKLFPEYTELLVKDKHAARSDVIKNLFVLVRLLEPMKAVDTVEDLYNFLETLKAVAKPKKVKK